MLAYGFMLLKGANLLSDGSEMLLEVLNPGIIGGMQTFLSPTGKNLYNKHWPMHWPLSMAKQKTFYVLLPRPCSCLFSNR